MSERDGPPASLKRIAQELGVSAKTVSNAFNRPDQLSAVLRERILETARRMDYAGPDPTARAFRRGQSGMVGVIYANALSYAFANPAAVAFLAGVAEVLETEDIGLALIAGSAGTARSAEGLGRAVVDGVIAYSLASDDPALEAARQRGRPTVTVDQPRLAGGPWVGIDDRTAARTVARELVAAGHRRVGIVSFAIDRASNGSLVTLDTLPPATLEVTARRLNGYRDALAAYTSPGNIPVVHGPDSTVMVGRAGAMAMLTSHPDLTALICLSDQLAIGAIEAVTDLGRTVPHDLSVVGFDGTQLAGADGLSLTTIRQPHEDKGRTAARLLLAALRGEAPESVTLPHELIVGTSVTPIG
jgi:DNA-binding LacI/PurR family transcriptional regulator